MLKKMIICLIAIMLIIPTMLFGYLFFRLNSIYDKDEAKKIDQNISKSNKESNLENILLVGVDGDNLEKGNRSDSMIILTIDEKNKKLKLTSLARDTLADIENYGEEKLTHAYAYGGPYLLLETINNNFGLTIDKYVAVNFESFKKIIDIIGGIEIDVLEKEVSYIPGVDRPGNQTLNGEKSLAYSRIRYADSAYVRDQRQRTVIESAYEELKQSSYLNIFNIADNILNHTNTNIPPVEVFKLLQKIIQINSPNFDQLEFPIDGYREGKNIDKKGWVIIWDKEYNKNKLKEFIHN